LRERVVREASSIATDGDTLGKLKLNLTFVTPFESAALIFLANQDEVGVTVGKLILLALSGIESRVRDFSFGADSNEFNIFAKAELLHTTRNTRVQDHGISTEGCSCNSSHGLSSSLGHSTTEDNNRCRRNEFKSISDFTNSELLAARSRNSDQFSSLASRNHNIVQGPALFSLVELLIVRDECLSEVVLVLIIVLMTSKVLVIFEGGTSAEVVFVSVLINHL
jgi:hypothetical protein